MLVSQSNSIIFLAGQGWIEVTILQMWHVFFLFMLSQCTVFCFFSSGQKCAGVVCTVQLPLQNPVFLFPFNVIEFNIHLEVSMIVLLNFPSMRS